MIFNLSNWSTDHTATISGIDIQVDDGDQPFTIITSNAISTDSAYNGVPVPDVTGVNINNGFWPDSVNDAYQTNANPNRPRIFFSLTINWNDKKVLVTGAGGFIASHLVDILVQNGVQVRALVRYNSRGDPSLLTQLPTNIYSELEIIPGDLRDLSAWALVGMCPLAKW